MIFSGFLLNDFFLIFGRQIISFRVISFVLLPDQIGFVVRSNSFLPVVNNLKLFLGQIMTHLPVELIFIFILAFLLNFPVGEIVIVLSH